MNKLLDELKAVPGVVGGFVLHQREGILVNNLPSFFKESRLLEIGKKLQKIWSAGRMSFPDVSEASLFYEESVLILRAVGEQLFLVLVCEPSINTNMLSMSINLALEDLETLEPPPAAAAFEESVAEPLVAAADPGELLSGPLAEVLERLQGGLAGVMGPMAELIFEEALEQWCAAGRTTREELPALVEIITAEIGDEQKSERFAALARPHIQADA